MQDLGAVVGSDVARSPDSPLIFPQALASNNTFVYLPAYRSPLRPGDSWSFGFTLASNATEFPKVEPIYGQLADGRFFNYTSIIEPPQNPTVSPIFRLTAAP